MIIGLISILLLFEKRIKPMKSSFFILIILIILSACVFSPSEENFVEIEKNISPPEISDQILDLNSDTLFVWKYTRFNFNLTAGDVAIHSAVVSYNNSELNFGSGQGSFDVNPSTIQEGTYKVEIKAYTGSGTGSLADKLGAEGYEFQREWVLVVEKPKIPDIKLALGIENGYLKISWNKVDKPYFRSYRLLVYDNGAHDFYSREYTNRNITSFVDSTYVGGNITFNLSVNYYDENNYEKWAENQISYDFPINIKFKENKDSLTISWNKNPFHCTKTLIANSGSELYEIKSDSTFTIAAQGLGGLKNFDLIFKPANKSQFSTDGFHNYAEYTLGVNDGIKHSNVEYNQELGTYYFKHEMSAKSANHIFETTGVYNYSWDYRDNYTLSFSQDNEYLFTTIHGNLVCLRTADMGLVSSNSLSFIDEGIHKAQVLKNLGTTNFLIAYNNGLAYKIVLFDSSTREVLDNSVQLPADNVLTGNSLFSVSENNKYVVFSNRLGLWVFGIEDNRKLTPIYQDSNEYYGCFFDPKYPEKLILNTPSNFKIFNCSSKIFEKTIDRFYANPINIDPVTHNMLLVSNSKKKIYVYDYESDKLILEMNHHGLSTDFKLLNNNILVNSGFHFDISSYVS